MENDHFSDQGRKKTLLWNMEYYLASFKTGCENTTLKANQLYTKYTSSYCKYLQPLQRPSLCVFPVRKHRQRVSQSVRLLPSVRWRLIEADTSCKHRSDTCQVGVEAKRLEGSSRGDRQTTVVCSERDKD